MNSLILLTFVVLSNLSVSLCQTYLLDQINFIASQWQYGTQVYSQPKAPFSTASVMDISMETAMRTCQNSFKFERWNCPTSDFLSRITSDTMTLDPEDSYVRAITTAAILFSITKNCSTGIIADCNNCSDNLYSSQCSDNPKAAEKLFEQHFCAAFTDDSYGKATQHNHKAVTNLLQNSLVKQCSCANVNSNGLCSNKFCVQVLKPFEDIAAAIRKMYDEGIHLGNTPRNSRIMWHNIPLDSLVYMKDSPNYCEPDAVLNWNGMGGRKCSTVTSGKHLTKEDRRRCLHLCRDCGYTVRSKNVVIASSCNCQFTWGYQIHCNTCATVQRQYYCS